MDQISIHALLAESDYNSGNSCTQAEPISIHALLAESDTRLASIFSDGAKISIHALLAESDAVTTLDGGSDKDFYPRSPCGERQAKRWNSAERPVISIHALLAESDASQTNLPGKN